MKHIITASIITAGLVIAVAVSVIYEPMRGLLDGRGAALLPAIFLTWFFALSAKEKSDSRRRDEPPKKIQSLGFYQRDKAKH